VLRPTRIRRIPINKSITGPQRLTLFFGHHAFSEKSARFLRTLFPDFNWVFSVDLHQINQRFPSFHARILWAYHPNDVVFRHPFNVIVNIGV
jgi:hypothetical protein